MEGWNKEKTKDQLTFITTSPREMRLDFCSVEEPARRKTRKGKKLDPAMTEAEETVTIGSSRP